MWRLSVFIAVLAIATGIFVAQNPFLFGLSTKDGSERYFVYYEDVVLDRELSFVRSYIPDADFEAYRNHCLRVMTFAKYFLSSSSEKEKDFSEENVMKVIAMAVAYHDVALWTDGKLDYLEPSIRQMYHYVWKEGIFSEDDIDLAREIINQHHKFTNFKSKKKSSSSKSFDTIVNAVRKADWADFTYGIVRFQLPSSLLEDAYAKVPEAGLHQMLATFGPRLSPDSILGQLKVLRILKW